MSSREEQIRKYFWILVAMNLLVLTPQLWALYTGEGGDWVMVVNLIGSLIMAFGLMGPVPDQRYRKPLIFGGIILMSVFTLMYGPGLFGA